jgi:hypothetical protein
MNVSIDDLQLRFSNELGRQRLKRDLQQLPTLNSQQIERIMSQLAAVASRLTQVVS